MPDIGPSDLTSPAAGLAARARLEETVGHVVGDEMTSFAMEVRKLASEAAEPGRLGVFTYASIVALWVAAANRAEQRLSPQIGATYAAEVRSGMIGAETPSKAFDAGTAALSQGAGAALSVPAVRQLLTRHLGLSALSEFFGRFTVTQGGDSSTFSWQKEGDAIARTSSTRAAAVNMLDLLREEGYTHKRWMTRYDSRVRETHAAVDRTTIELDASFIVGGSALGYPADPQGAAAETINCRCLLVGVRYGRHALDHPEGTEPWNNPRP